MAGLVLFRWFGIICYFLIFASWTNLRNRNVLMVIAVVTVMILEFYSVERPQFASFVCFGILLTLLLKFVDQPEARPLCSVVISAALVMVIWANLHGGVLVGQAVICFLVFIEGVKFSHFTFSPLPWRSYRKLLLIAVCALTASFLQPNAFNSFMFLPKLIGGNDYVTARNLEYLSLYDFFRLNYDYTVLAYAAAIILTVLALWRSPQRTNLTWVGILAITAVMGYRHIRYMPFFLITAALFNTKFVELGAFTRIERRVLVLFLVATTFYCVKDEFSLLAETTRSGMIPQYQLPVKAADFLLANKIQGNIYTSHYWGGYFIWRVGPSSKIFYDGRGLSVQRVWEYNNSLTVVPGRRPYWKGLFRQYDIRIAVLPSYETNGKPNILWQSFANDPEWIQIFSGEHERIFVLTGLSHQISDKNTGDAVHEQRLKYD